MRLLIDMNLSPRLAQYLSAAGFPAEHWAKLGDATTDDSELMAFAVANDYVILTHDLDFGTILAATRGNSPSVVQIRADYLSPQSIGAQILVALRQAGEALAVGALVTVDLRRLRITLLPIRTAVGK